jgi:hypothetical protein
MGVGVHNLWVKPAVHIVRDAPIDTTPAVRRATLKIDGLLCSL